MSYLDEAVCGDVDLLRPGPEVQVRASPVLLWRVLTNMVDNAAPAGSAGRVKITVGMLANAPPRALLQVQDTGPGFGRGSPGAASLGLGVVTALPGSCGGSKEVQAPADGGGLVRIVLPAEPVPMAVPHWLPTNQVGT